MNSKKQLATRPVTLVITLLVHMAMIFVVFAGFGHQHQHRTLTVPLEVSLLARPAEPWLAQPAAPPSPQVVQKPKPDEKQIFEPPRPLPTPLTPSTTPSPAPTPQVAASEPSKNATPTGAPLANAAPAKNTTDQGNSPVKVGVSVNASYASANVTPPYPRLAQKLGEEGSVVVRVLVSTEGVADKVELKKSSGSSILDQAALDTFKKWRFNPATIDGRPVADWFDIQFKFSLGS
jgi:protein TonB